MWRAPVACEDEGGGPGYLITAFALTPGAPFWFDTLNRIMVIRATAKPKEGPDEPSEDGGKDASSAPPAAPKK